MKIAVLNYAVCEVDIIQLSRKETKVWKDNIEDYLTKVKGYRLSDITYMTGEDIIVNYNLDKF